MNHDAAPAENTFHTITDCKAPCNRSTGIAYPIANGPSASTPASSASTTPVQRAGRRARHLDRRPRTSSPGTYSYFCRVHPFMRGSFRVVK